MDGGARNEARVSFMQLRLIYSLFSPDLTVGDQWASEFAKKMLNSNLSDDALEQEFDSIFRSGLDQYSNFNPLDELPSEYEFAQVSFC
jgi:hypothetical protein